MTNIYQELLKDKALLAECVEFKLGRKEFLSRCTERYKGEWTLSTKSYNIRRSDIACKHKCAYCYVAPMFKRFKRELVDVDMEDIMPVDEKKVSKGWLKSSSPQMYFFPSTSDIFKENAVDYANVCSKIIKAGHKVMWVTKASYNDVLAVARAHIKYGNVDGLKVYVTISTDDDRILRMVEANTPLYEERLRIVCMLGDLGFDVNVMMEPYLTDPIRILPTLLDLLPLEGFVAIGRMNYKQNSVLCNDEADEKELRETLESLYSDKEVLRLWGFIKDNPRVILKKETIMAILKASVNK